MASHEPATNEGLTNVWLTPPGILSALGPFDLDPCAPQFRPWDMAARHLTVNDNGLACPWHGRVWMNPPYGRDIGAWMARLSGHGTGTALVYARTETAWFHRHVWQSATATAALFLFRRVVFCRPDGTPAPNHGGAPSVLVAYGRADAERLQGCGLAGGFVRLRA